MSHNVAELTVQDLRDMDVLDAAIFRLLLAEGQEPTPDNLQKRFSEVGQYYLRRSLSLL